MIPDTSIPREFIGGLSLHDYHPGTQYAFERDNGSQSSGVHIHPAS
jgi:hypothetical protein